MRKITILIALIFTIVVNSDAKIKDLLELMNGKKVKGVIVNIEQSRIHFLRKGEITIYTQNQVKYVVLDSENKKILKMVISNVPLQDQNFCTDGEIDADNFHKRGGGNFALGLFFGVFGFVGVAVTDAKAPYHPSLVSDTEKMNNQTYIMCYDKKAKKKNLASAGIGWGVGFILLILLLAGS